MPNQQISIGLKFNADVGQARQQLQSLKQSLLDLGNLSNISPTAKLNANIGESIAAVAKLRTQLEAATNVNTGRLDLTKFNKQLRNSGMDLTKYRTQLSALGPEGQKVFLGLASSIQQAEAPLLTLNKLASNLWDSLARTAKWQLSSTAIHALVGSFEKAYGYAKDLNESLNNIRIVSGQSVDQMAKFAVEANKAAKNLSTTTKAYTDASLIYYQQGLTDAEVKKRTDVTVKMANVIGESAESVSQDLTAVWNNFAKGGDNLERFADKMVALGTSTASSSQEIATGLEKFAATAQTTGLSFDYAAAALATVTAQTRQSAETVGTSFKTIFARLESLKLGDTLEDGTDLTKYSQALATVGVNVKQANGELKDMDQIIDETMTKWSTLTKDQQVALAQTVAGQRQYNQFMALMSNADFFRENLKTINSSTGALQEQSEIYQESWAAASKRVQAAMEEIYNKVLDDKFFIGATEHLEKFITMISRMIDSMGGIGGVLTTIAAVSTKLFGDQMATGIRNITFDIQNLVTNGRKAEELRDQATKELNAMDTSNDIAIEAGKEQYIEINKMTKDIADNQNKISSAQKDQLQTVLQIRKLQAERITDLKEEEKQIDKNSQENRAYLQENIDIKKASKIINDNIGETSSLLSNQQYDAASRKKFLEKRILKRTNITNIEDLDNYISQRQQQITTNKQKHKAYAKDQEALDQLKAIRDELKQVSQESEQAKTKLNALTELVKNGNIDIGDKILNFEQIRKAETSFKDLSMTLETSFKDNTDIENKKQAFKEFIDEISKTGIELKDLGIDIDKFDLETEQGLTEALNKVSEARIKHSTSVRQEYDALMEVIRASSLDEATKEVLINALRDANALGVERGHVLSKEAQAALDAAKAEASFNKILAEGKKIDYATAIVSATNALSSFGSAVGAIKGMIDTLNNEDLSFFEKLQQFLVSMPMAVSMLQSGLSGVTKTIGEIKSIKSTISGVSKGSGLGGLASLLSLRSGGAQGLEGLKGLLADGKSLNDLNPFKTGTTAQDIVKSSNGLIKLSQATEMANGKMTAAKAITSSFGSSLLSLGAAAAAVAIVVGVIALAIKQYNKDADAAKSAAQAHEQLAQAADEAADAYENLKNTITGYDEAVDKTKALVEGTLEYKEALAEANKQAIELIKNNPTLASQYKYNDKGLIEFTNPNALKEAQEAAFQRQQDLAGRAQMAELAANQAQQRADRTQFARKNVHAVNGYGAANSAIMGAGGVAAGALLGTAFLPGIGTLTGAALGAIIGAIGGVGGGAIASGITGAATQNEKTALESLTDAYSSGDKAITELIGNIEAGTAKYNDIVTTLDNVSGISTEVAHSLANSAEEMAEFVKTQGAINVENEVLLKSSIRNALTGQSDFDNSLYKEAIVNSIAKEVNQVDENSKYYKAAKDLLNGKEDELAAKYLSAMYGDQASNYRIVNKGGTNWTLQQKNEHGTFETLGEKNTLSQDSVLWAVANDDAMKEYTANLPTTAAEQEAIGKQFGKLIQSIGADLAEEELNTITANLVAQYSDNGVLNLTDLTFEQLDKLKEAIRTDSDAYKEMDETARKAFDTAIKGAAEAKRQANLQASGNYESNRAGIEAEMFAKGAESANLTSQEFDLWAKSIANANEELELTERESKLIATDIAKTSKAIETLGDSYDDIKGTLEKIRKNSKEMLTPEEIQDVTVVQQALKEWLGVEFTFEQIAEHSDLIESALQGSIEATRDLQKESALILADSLDINDNLKSQFKQFLDEVDAAVDENHIAIGVDLGVENEQEFLDDINAAVAAGEVSAEQLEGLFLNAGHQLVPDGTQPMKLPPQTTESTSWTVDDNGKKIAGTRVKTVSEIVQTIQVPKYKGIKTLGSGSTQTLAPSKSGGSSSGSKNKERKASDEIDRYHEVNRSLDVLSKKYSKLNEEKERAFGPAHLAAIDKEISVLKGEEKLLDARADQARAYLAQDRAAVLKYGAVFDANGNIANYNQLIANAVNSGMEDQPYEEMKKALQQYENSLDTLNDTLDEKAAKAREILDKHFEKVEYTVQFKLDVSEFKNSALDWRLGNLEDLDFKGAERMALYQQKGNLAQTDFETNRQGIINTLKVAGATQEQIDAYMNGNGESLIDIFKDNEQVVTKVKEYTQGMIDARQALLDVKKAIEEELTTAWEEQNDKIEESIKLYDHLDKKISFFKDITDIIGIKRLGMTAEAISRINESSINLMQKQVQSTKDQLEMNEKALVDARAARAKATTEADQKYWDDYIKTIQSKVNELSDSVLDQGKNLIKAIQDDFAETVENVFNEFEDRMAGAYSSFEDMQTAFDQQKTLKEQYLPEYQKLYELNKLNRNLNKDLSKLNGPAAQEKLRDLLKEINDLQQDGVKMSQYDLEYLQKRYDLRLAEIALEESYQNKKTVRLTRDTSGNYNYVYTADADLVADSAQKFEDALYNTQKISEDYINQLSENYLKLEREHLDALRQIMADTSLTADERNAKIQQTNEFYTAQMKYISDELQKALGNNIDLYNNEYTQFANTRSDIENRGDTFTKYFNETLLGNILDGYNSLESYMNDYLTYLGSVDDGTGALGDLTTRANNMETMINGVLQTVANTDMANFATDSARELDKVDGEVEELGNKIEKLKNDANIYLGKLVEIVTKTQTDLDEPFKNMTKQVEDLSKAYEGLITKLDTMVDKYNNLPVGDEDAEDIGATGTVNPGTDKLIKQGRYVFDDSTMDNIDVGELKYNSKGEKGTTTNVSKSIPSYSSATIDTKNSKAILTGEIDGVKIKAEKEIDSRYHGYFDKWGILYEFDTKNMALDASKKDPDFLEGSLFNTGGYTGAWGPEGKLAMLHEKELVLNKLDTQNILATVDLVRQLADIVDLQKLSARAALNSTSARGMLSSINNESNNLQQDIHIEANFPGVTAKEEIEQAFAELATQASQYIHRY